MRRTHSRQQGRIWQRWTGARRGAAAVELAMMSPLMCIFVFGLLEMGQAVKCYQAVVNATRRGARYASSVFTVADSSVSGGVRTARISDAANEVTEYLKNAFPYASNATVSAATDMRITVSELDGGSYVYGVSGGSGSGDDAILQTIDNKAEIIVDLQFDFKQISWLQILGFRYKPILRQRSAMSRE